MNTLVAYATKHGITKKCAEILKEKISGEVKLIDLKKNPNIDITPFEAVIIGSSIYMGRPLKAAVIFCRNNMKTLLEKKIGLFICHMQEGTDSVEEFKTAYPEELLEHATVRGFFGGGFHLESMNFLEKMIVKAVGGVTQSVSNIKEENIAEFALKF
jgi:menaquinone-dependent protoporphyrinogen oxidase